MRIITLYYYHTEAFVRRHARGGKIYLGVVDIAHSGGVLLCKNIVIPAVVLRNKFCESSIKCEEKNTTWCKFKTKTLIFCDNTQNSAYVSLPMGRAWISATRTVDNTARRREISIAKPATIDILYCPLSSTQISSPHKNSTAKNVVII